MKKLLVTEIVGPAGAGKSTLARTLRSRDETIQTGVSVWGLPHSLLALNIFASLRDISRDRRSRLFRLDEFELIVRMNALHSFITREPRNGYRTLLVDEGIIFAIGKLCTLDCERGQMRELDACMKRLLARWAERLCAVVWLDAPDSVLTERIRSRPQPHRVKAGSDREIQKFLSRYRDSYEHILSEFNSDGRLKVIRLDTSLESTERIADRVLQEIGVAREAHVVC